MELTDQIKGENTHAIQHGVPVSNEIKKEINRIAARNSRAKKRQQLEAENNFLRRKDETNKSLRIKETKLIEVIKQCKHHIATSIDENQAEKNHFDYPNSFHDSNSFQIKTATPVSEAAFETDYSIDYIPTLIYQEQVEPLKYPVPVQDSPNSIETLFIPRPLNQLNANLSQISGVNNIFFDLLYPINISSYLDYNNSPFLIENNNQVVTSLYAQNQPISNESASNINLDSSSFFNHQISEKESIDSRDRIIELNCKMLSNLQTIAGSACLQPETLTNDFPNNFYNLDQSPITECIMDDENLAQEIFDLPMDYIGQQSDMTFLSNQYKRTKSLYDYRIIQDHELKAYDNLNINNAMTKQQEFTLTEMEKGPNINKNILHMQNTNYLFDSPIKGNKIDSENKNKHPLQQKVNDNFFSYKRKYSLSNIELTQDDVDMLLTLSV